MDLEAILPRYSNIKKLTVTKFPYQYIFNYIPRLCPNLESFTFHRNKDGCHQDHRFPVTLPIRPTLPMFQGKLHTLILMEDDFATPMPWDMMKNILEQASPTLQQLHCCFYFTNTRFTSILGADPPRFNLPELKILKCTVGEGKSQKYVASLICNAPKLAAVTIRNYARTQRIADQILDALIGLDHLTWLELLESRFSKQLNEKKLISLFDKHAALGDKAPLQCVSLDGPFVKRDILAPLTKVVTLRGIDLGFCNPNLNKFIVAVKKLKHFHDLRVMKMGTVTNDTLLKFASIPNLKRFILLACKNVNSNGLFKLVDNSLSLEELQISEGTNRSSKFEVHAKEKLAKFCIYSNFDDDNFV
ncbi:hypothetical protein BDA99DRAFT_85040 [Phascolomyces articulosus]|uniref:Uncharacterized protein n=1 Tax=Phascolomyces articulosus TaxID=60185 RepID=A0AAD5K7Y5_9FUNG|nr:hypothetical protein BDA99DRAFT_85040 [Phascolomyces articulosus]